MDGVQWAKGEQQAPVEKGLVHDGKVFGYNFKNNGEPLLSVERHVLIFIIHYFGEFVSYI